MLCIFFVVSVVLMVFFIFVLVQEFNFFGGYECFDFDIVDFDMVVLWGSYFFNDNFGLEGQLNFGIDDDIVIVVNILVNVEFNYGVGVFVVVCIGIDGFNLFGCLGYYYFEVEVNLVGYNVQGDDGVLVVGVGVEFDFDDCNVVCFDYIYIDYDDSVNVLGLIYVCCFGGQYLR